MQVRFLGLEDPLEEENGNPLQYSCLENPMERGAWRAMVHGVAEFDTTEATEHSTHSTWSVHVTSRHVTSRHVTSRNREATREEAMLELSLQKKSNCWLGTGGKNISGI